MSVDVRWDNEEKTILRYNFSGFWSWEEYFPSLARGRDMMRQQAHYVCVLNDMRQAAHIPKGFITKARDVISTRPPNTGLSLFLTTSLLFKETYRVLGSIYPEIPPQYLLVETEEEALERLKTWLATHKYSVE